VKFLVIIAISLVKKNKDIYIGKKEKIKEEEFKK
jgi:hypothetical protein